MPNIKQIIFGILILLVCQHDNCFGQTDPYNKQAGFTKITLPGAYSMNSYLGRLRNKRVALVANHTSMIGQRHLLDTLLNRGIRIDRIFSPEHGFRGDHSDGALISNNTDPSTGLKIISLYGNHKKPSQADLKGVDIVVFDIQDVGVRFYTYISTLTLVMQACAENNIPLLLFDRPNPNGFYIDGPVLQPALKSFVGMHPVPIVYGMTIGEYALMVNGEKWLENGQKCQLKVVPCINYSHKSRYTLPVNPSPNLRSPEAILLYPSLCLFEGTIVSVGRGTENPFTIVGYPGYLGKDGFSFTPKSMPGISDSPPYKDQLCYGINLLNEVNNLDFQNKINVKLITKLYKECLNKSNFFTDYFDKLAGNHQLKMQIIKGMKEKDIRNSWQKDLNKFKKIRKKYLLYPD